MVEEKDCRAKSGSARAAEVHSKSSALDANLFDHGLTRFSADSRNKVLNPTIVNGPIDSFRQI